MANGNGVNFLRNWGAVIIMGGAIAIWLAGTFSHADDPDIHMKTEKLDILYVPADIFELRMENIELKLTNIKSKMAEDRIILNKILDNQR